MRGGELGKIELVTAIFYIKIETPEDTPILQASNPVVFRGAAKLWAGGMRCCSRLEFAVPFSGCALAAARLMTGARRTPRKSLSRGTPLRSSSKTARRAIGQVNPHRSRC